MLRTLLLLSLALTVSACPSKTESTKAAPEKAAADKAAPEKAAPAAAAGKSHQLADLAFKPFDPKKPEGVQVFPVAGNPKEGAFTAVVRMPAGHMSPLHMHTASHSGVALSDGIVHGASDTNSQRLPSGSTWYQPGGEAHVGGCKSESACDMLVFFDGAIDMVPAETPAAEPKMRMTPSDKVEWKELKGGVRMAVINGNPKEGAFQALFEFPAGMTTNVHTHTASFTGGLLSGTHQRGASPDTLVTLTAGAVWSEPAGSPHMEKCGAESKCVFAGAMDGALDTKNVELTPATK